MDKKINYDKSRQTILDIVIKQYVCKEYFKGQDINDVIKEQVYSDLFNGYKINIAMYLKIRNNLSQDKKNKIKDINSIFEKVVEPDDLVAKYLNTYNANGDISQLNSVVANRADKHIDAMQKKRAPKKSIEKDITL